MNAEDEKFIEAFYILTGRVPILPLEIDFNGIEELYDNNLIEAKKEQYEIKQWPRKEPKPYGVRRVLFAYNHGPRFLIKEKYFDPIEWYNKKQEKETEIVSKFCPSCHRDVKMFRREMYIYCPFCKISKKRDVRLECSL